MQADVLIGRLHEHRQWVNRSLIAAARELSPSQLRREFPIGQGSVWQSLLHMYAAEYVWLEALLGDDNPLVPGDLPGKLPGNQQGDTAIESLDELKEKWAILDRRWDDYLANLARGHLDELVSKKSTRSGKGILFRTKASDVLLHVCTHAQYTTAQVVNMLRQLGVGELPDAMLISLAREQAASAD